MPYTHRHIRLKGPDAMCIDQKVLSWCQHVVDLDDLMVACVCSPIVMASLALHIHLTLSKPIFWLLIRWPNRGGKMQLVSNNRTCTLHIYTDFVHMFCGWANLFNFGIDWASFWVLFVISEVTFVGQRAGIDQWKRSSISGFVSVQVFVKHQHGIRQIPRQEGKNIVCST